MDAAEAAEEEGIGLLEVIDLRSLVLLDEDTLVASLPRPAAWWSSTRPRSSSAWAPRSPPGSPRPPSSTWRVPVLRRTGLDIPYPPARPRKPTSPASTGSSGPSSEALVSS